VTISTLTIFHGTFYDDVSISHLHKASKVELKNWGFAKKRSWPNPWRKPRKTVTTADVRGKTIKGHFQNTNLER